MDSKKKEIFALSLDGLKEVFSSLQLPSFRAKQVYHWLYQKNVWLFSEMSNLAKKDMALLHEYFSVLPANLVLLDELISGDGLTKKLLLQFYDGNTVETVGMRHNYGNSVCVSSQVGCAMGCGFCASTLNGFVRNLTAGEMLAQVALFQKQYQEEGGRVDKIVIMGSGEPFLNYDEVIKFIRLLHDKDIYNISYRNITISTCGIIPGIKKMIKEEIPVSLAISLHAPLDDLRDSLMPVNQKYKVKAVIAAAKEYAEASKRQVTYEYLLLKNINDSSLCAGKLADLLQGTLASVNLIPFNSVKEKNWQKSDKKQIDKFMSVLQRKKISVTVRKEMGADIKAACGQLRAKYIGDGV